MRPGTTSLGEAARYLWTPWTRAEAQLPTPTTATRTAWLLAGIAQATTGSAFRKAFTGGDLAAEATARSLAGLALYQPRGEHSWLHVFACTHGQGHFDCHAAQLVGRLGH